jgi:Rrf2 family protein
MSSIVNFSDAAAIGIHGMIALARKGEPINAIELSKILLKSKHHIGKVMQRLVKTGFLESYRGPTGGFKLKADPEKLTMYDIYAAIEGPVEVKGCDSEHHLCPSDKCINNNVVKVLTIEFIQYMKKETLAAYL